MDYDVIIIGAGVVGLAVAAKISQAGKSVLVLEKEHTYGLGTSSRNSEVIHAGLYYPKNSLKSKLCIRGNALLYEYCCHNKISCCNVKKLVIGIDENDEANFKHVYNNAVECGVNGIDVLDTLQIKAMEPEVKAKFGFLSNNTGIINSHEYMRCLYNEAEANNCDFAFNHSLENAEKINDNYLLNIVDTNNNKYTVNTCFVINCSGLYSDITAEQFGIDIDKYNYRLSWCKGNYYRLINSKSKLFNHLIYPVPSANFVGLGIHLTKELDGNVKFGPDTEFINNGQEDYSVNSALAPAFFESIHRYLNKINYDDIYPDQSGIRPKLKTEKGAFRDFIINDEVDKGLPGLINLVGIESPGLTSSLAISEYVLNLLKDRYDFK